MRFLSTRDARVSADFPGALTQGLAPDGGLYVPERWPALDTAALARAADAGDSAAAFAGSAGRLAGLGAQLIAPFAAHSALEPALAQITAEAFDFPAPLVPLTDQARLSVLELFHGPTAAFKDFGARFLAACLQRLRTEASAPLLMLVATSGDTGGAVAAAFHGRPGVEVAVLYPRGLVSPTQERQLTCWGGNVRAFAVEGTFDDCQRLVKEALRDPELRSHRALSSANSINLGRLLPQTVYYAAASLAVWRGCGEPASFIVPSGNLGNSLACIWARRLGMPIREIVLAHNANRAVPDYLGTGRWEPRPSIATLASAMDVGDPSNMERLRAMYPDFEQLRGAVSAGSVDDAAIRTRIREGFERYGQVWCPHTATAAEIYERLSPQRRAAGRWVLVATAHAAKFREIVEPVIGCSVRVPPALERLFSRPVRCTALAPELAALRRELS